LDNLVIFVEMETKRKKLDFNNPDALSLLQQFTRWIFGAERPGFWIRTVFYVQLFGWSLFFFWYVLAFFSIKFVDKIRGASQLKLLLAKRGNHLGIPGFQEAYENFAFLMILLLAVFLIGLVLLWRQRKSYAFVCFGVWLAFPVMVVVFLNLNYLLEDVSFFDQVLYGVLIGSLSLFHVFIGRKFGRKSDELVEQDDSVTDGLPED
jgi:hypothetical protein